VEWKEDLSKAIVPLHPVVDCLIIKAWATSQKESDIQSIQAPGDPIAIPRIVSKRPGARTPLVYTMVRRSPRINPSAVDGYQIVPVKIKEPAIKCKKKVTTQLDLDNKLPARIEDVMNPTSMQDIKNWVAACGVAPEELSDDVLMQGHDEEHE
jgi:hypothetical protein